MTRLRRVAPLRAAAHLLVATYPRAWHDRYGAELADILDRTPISALTLFDLALAALDARRHPELAPAVVLTASHRARSGLVSIFLAYLVFALCWAAVLSVRDPLPLWEAAMVHHRDLWLSVSAVQLTGALAFLALLAGGITVLAAAFVRAVHTGNQDVLRWLGVAFAALAVFVACVGAATVGWFVPLNHAVGAAAVSLAFAATVLTALLVGAGAVARVIWCSEIDPRLLRLALRAGVIVVVAMGACLAASVTLGALVMVDAPSIGAPTAALLPMALVTAWSVAALRGTRSPTTAAGSA